MAPSSDIPVGRESTSYRLVGLKPGVLHTVYIWALKGDKVSKKSSTEAETAGCPYNFLARDETESSFRVSWVHTKAEVDGYMLSYSSSEGLNLDAPANLLARDETESSFSVSWDPVQAEIDGYILTYSSSEGSSEEIRVGSDSSSYRLTGLRPGVLYTVYIWAIKGSKASSKISTKAETDIDAPKDLKATDVSLESALMTWVPPLADIEGYILTYRDEEGNMETVEKQIGASESSFALSSLETGKKYIVTIIAYRGSKRSKVVETFFKTVGLVNPFPVDCTQVMKNGNKKSGIYTLYLNNDRSKPFEGVSRMETDGGGWLVLQRRNTGKLDFMKRWNSLDKIYELTNTPTQYVLRVELGLGAERAYAVYDDFKIATVKQKFRLTIGKYSGDSRWGDSRHSLGVNWEPWKGHLVSLDFTEMKIRPLGAMSSRKRRSLMAREKSRATNPQKK
ncbi:hypothetical protein KUCAC02_019150 [Chaenocephalus aceratus]|uniref:Uncharacterized protein n=1 Tax=Chaenocephalus aceratus TaxID=36190 RepID=A0ACB9WCE0_CHAAC|nr:hypothetical protein KUCAC02_019150 [Chaenocephalus aceratus]